jgi:hypothetical protein
MLKNLFKDNKKFILACAGVGVVGIAALIYKYSEERSTEQNDDEFESCDFTDEEAIASVKKDNNYWNKIEQIRQNFVIGCKDILVVMPEIIYLGLCSLQSIFNKVYEFERVTRRKYLDNFPKYLEVILKYEKHCNDLLINGSIAVCMDAGIDGIAFANIYFQTRQTDGQFSTYVAGCFEILKTNFPSKIEHCLTERDLIDFLEYRISLIDQIDVTSLEGKEPEYLRLFKQEYAIDLCALKYGSEEDDWLRCYQLVLSSPELIRLNQEITLRLGYQI